LQVNASKLVVFSDHFLHNGINLVLLFSVLLESLLFELFVFLNLALNSVFVVEELAVLLGVSCSLLLVLEFLVAKHDHVNVGVLLLYTVTVMLSKALQNKRCYSSEVARKTE